MVNNKKILIVVESLDVNIIKFNFIEKLISKGDRSATLLLIENNKVVSQEKIKIIPNTLFSLIQKFEMRRNIRKQKKYKTFYHEKSLKSLCDKYNDLLSIESEEDQEVIRKSRDEEVIVNLTRFDLANVFQGYHIYSISPYLDYTSNNPGLLKSILAKDDSGVVTINEAISINSDDSLQGSKFKVRLPVHRVLTVTNLLAEIRVLNLLFMIISGEVSLNKDNDSDTLRNKEDGLIVSDLFKYVLDKISHKITGNKAGKFLIYYLHIVGNKLDYNDKKIIEPRSSTFVADPFLLEHEEKIYCFYEEYDANLGKGKISVSEYKDSRFEYLGEALKENYHLSYPYVFIANQDIYMVPETAEANQVRLYKAADFPKEWKLETVLLDNISAVDTNIIYFQDYWWLFTNTDSSKSLYPGLKEHGLELSIFYSKELTSNNWTPHRLNPVIFDSENARGAGFIKDNDNLIRVSQKKGFGNQYGKGISFQKITELSSTLYSEEKVDLVEYVNFPKNFFVHHIDKFENLIVFDGRYFD